jgi:hypothetical protein
MVFTVERRERLRAQLVEVGRADPGVSGVAHVGSFAGGRADRWSDIDLAVCVDSIGAVMDRWTEAMRDVHSAIHWWDLPFSATVYRVFLLADGLEVDVAFAPADDYGPRGPDWRAVFGPVTTPTSTSASPPAPGNTVGLCWHHVLHAVAAVDRGRLWEAEWLINQGRHHVLELACRRFGLPSAHGRGSDQLPGSVRAAALTALPGALDPLSLTAAARGLGDFLVGELALADDALAAALTPILATAFAELQPG